MSTGAEYGGVDFETRSLPNLLVATHRGFAFYVAFPKRSIPSLETCSMSLIPSAPFAHSLFSFCHCLPTIAGGAPALQFIATIKYHKRLMIADATRETWVYLGVKIQSHAKEFPLFLSGSHST
jgi:hypothetical protein